MAHPIGVTHKVELTYLILGLEHRFGGYVHCLDESGDPTIRCNSGNPDISLSALGTIMSSILVPAWASTMLVNTIELYRWDTAGPQASWELVTTQAVSGAGTLGGGNTPAQQISLTFRDQQGRVVKFALFEIGSPDLMQRYALATLPAPVADIAASILGQTDADLGSYLTSRSNLQIFSYSNGAATQSAHIYKKRVGFS